MYKRQEVHFVFAAPEEPKKVILHAGMKQFLTNFIVELFVLVLEMCIRDRIIIGTESTEILNGKGKCDERKLPENIR